MASFDLGIRIKKKSLLFSSESFQINFALSTTSKNRFFPPTKSFKILADEGKF